MLTQLINQIPTMLLQIPPMLRPMVQMVIQQKIASIHPVQLANFNHDFESLLDAIAFRDHDTVALLMERYHIPPGGILGDIAVRLMGHRVVNLHGVSSIAETVEVQQ